VTELAEPLPGFTDRPVKPIRGYLLYALAALFFGINGTASKAVLLTGLDAPHLTQLRLTAAAVILVMVVAAIRPAALRIRRSEIGLLLAYGVLGVVGTQLFYFIAIERIPVGIALLIEFTAPIWVALWFRFAWKHPTKQMVWVALLMALVGLALVAQVWQGITFNLFGAAAALGAAASLALYYLLSDVAMRRENPRDPISLTMWGFVIAAVSFAIVQPLWQFPVDLLSGTATLGTAQVPVWSLVGYIVIFGTIASFSLVVTSMKDLRASQASVIGLLEPLIAILVAWVLLGEAMTPAQIAGGALILLGVLVAERSR
jgi:drug/metabolite transporter (DMT)-like permease